jgi:DNA invertase Pin-like site-specific DNA recombinase
LASIWPSACVWERPRKTRRSPWSPDTNSTNVVQLSVTQVVSAAGYVRVSTADQARSGAGLDAQRQAIEGACTARGWSLDATCVDEAASGKSVRNRPGLAEALRHVETAPNAVLVVAKLDRLSRSVVDFAGLMQRAAKRGWRIVVLDVGVDTTTPNGELVANVLMSVAQWERRMIGLRTKEALAVKKAQGVQLGRPRTLPPDVAERVCELRADGWSYASIARLLNDDSVPTAQGGARWYPSTVRAISRQAPRMDRRPAE